MTRGSMTSMSTIHACLRRAGCALLAGALIGAAQGRAAAQFGEFNPADVLLVVAPHPDDETLCCAGAIQRARLVSGGLRVAELPQLRDVDTAADAVAVAREAPQTRFAARAGELAAVLSQVRTGKDALGASALGRAV